MELILYGHDQCCLCERLEALLRPHLEARGLTLTKRNIKTNRAWLRAYRDRIPVLIHGDNVVLEGNPTEEEVERCIDSLPSR